MAKSSVTFRVDGTMVVAAIALGGVGYLYYKRRAIAEVVTEDLNPTHQNNIVNRNAKSVIGEERLQGFFDGVFGTVHTIADTVSGREVNPHAKDNFLWGVFN